MRLVSQKLKIPKVEAKKYYNTTVGKRLKLLKQQRVKLLTTNKSEVTEDKTVTATTTDTKKFGKEFLIQINQKGSVWVRPVHEEEFKR